jgi:hypothetical protein
MKFIKWASLLIQKLNPLNGYYRVSVDCYLGKYPGDFITIKRGKTYKVVAIVGKDLILKELKDL